MPSPNPEVARALVGNQATGSLTAWEPSLRDRIAYLLSDAAGYLGAGRYAQQDIAQKTRDVVDFVPGVGEAVGLDDAWNDFQAGNYGMGVTGLGLTAVGAVPGVGDVASKSVRELVSRAPNSIDAMVGGKIVGTINLSENHPYVSSIFVEPDYRGQGIGTELYSAAENMIGRPLVPSPLGLSADAIKMWSKRLSSMDYDKAVGLLEESRNIGRSYGVRDEHIEERLMPLFKSLSNQ